MSCPSIRPTLTRCSVKQQRGIPCRRRAWTRSDQVDGLASSHECTAVPTVGRHGMPTVCACSGCPGKLVPELARAGGADLGRSRCASAGCEGALLMRVDDDPVQVVFGDLRQVQVTVSASLRLTTTRGSPDSLISASYSAGGSVAFAFFVSNAVHSEA